jgi:hypothetical protein
VAYLKIATTSIESNPPVRLLLCAPGEAEACGRKTGSPWRIGERCKVKNLRPGLISVNALTSRRA